MYDSFTHFLKTFSADQPVLWALLVMGVVAATSLALQFVWEAVPRLLFSGRSSTKRSTRNKR